MEFQIANASTSILAYSAVIFLIVCIAFFYSRKLFSRHSVLVIMRIVVILFAASILYPIAIPLWTRVVVDDTFLSVKSSLFNNRFELRELKLDEVRLYDNLPDSLTIKRRASGVRFSDLSVGNFTLRGGSPGILYVTRPNRFAVIPTTDNRYVILTLKDPDEFTAYLLSIKN